MSAHESFEKPASEQRENVNNDAFEPASTDDEVPELHIKTWLALAAMGVIQYTSLLALVSPSAVVSLPQNTISDSGTRIIWLTIGFFSCSWTT
jgi:hypothetical protein